MTLNQAKWTDKSEDTLTHPHTGSTGSAARIPEDSHSGNLLACSDSHADSDGYCYTHPHLRKGENKFLLITYFTNISSNVNIRTAIKDGWKTVGTIHYKPLNFKSLTQRNNIWNPTGPEYVNISCLLTFTLYASAIQGETFRAFTVEATRSVYTGSSWTTDTVLACALIVVCKETNKQKNHVIFICFSGK